MQTKPTNWDTYLSQLHSVETVVTIGGVEYDNENLVSIKTSGALYDKFSIGNATSRQLDLEIIPKSQPARQATISLKTRIVTDDGATDYIPKGTFFISQREQTDYGTLRMTCYDAMLKGEAEYHISQSEHWPQAPNTVIAKIINEIGVSLDSRNVVDNTILVPYPIEGDRTLTMREVLQWIATAQAGNFVISDAGNLRLIPLKSINEQGGTGNG